MADLSIRHLAKSFEGAPILRDVSLDVATGSLIAVLGASGSGKTTLLRLIAGFERPDQGEIRVGGELIASPSRFINPEQRGIGYVAQEGALFPHLSVADNITFGLSRAERRRWHRVTELLQLVGLPASYARRAPGELSGGEQQRVALARALAPGPKLLLLDEPFSALDAALRSETREAVAAAIATAGATAILVTHDQDEALSMGAKVGVLQNGVLAQMSEPQALYHQPATPELANFVGAAVFFPGFAGGGKVRCVLGELPLCNKALSGPVEVMVRPEQIQVLTSPLPGSVPAVIDHVTFYGHDAILRLTVSLPEADPQPVRDVTARIFTQSVPAPGAKAWLQVTGDVVAYAGPVLA
jgi:iron(III) transport system ATP-binding protein